MLSALFGSGADENSGQAPLVYNIQDKQKVAYFDNFGRDLGIFVIVGGFASVGRHGPFYELLLLPVAYVVIGLVVESYRAILRKNNKRDSLP